MSSYQNAIEVRKLKKVFPTLSIIPSNFRKSLPKIDTKRQECIQMSNDKTYVIFQLG